MKLNWMIKMNDLKKQIYQIRQKIEQKECYIIQKTRLNPEKIKKLLKIFLIFYVQNLSFFWKNAGLWFKIFIFQKKCYSICVIHFQRKFELLLKLVNSSPWQGQDSKSKKLGFLKKVRLTFFPKKIFLITFFNYLMLFITFNKID